MAGSYRKTRRTGCAIALAGFFVSASHLVPPTPVLAQSAIGIYSDAGGNTCSLSDRAQGFMDVYVVVKPGPQGVSAAQFSAPPPPCFTGAYLSDQSVPGTLVLGNSQTGVSVALTTCTVLPAHVLTIRYYGYGTSSDCCVYPVLPDPAVPALYVVDCFFNTEEAVGYTGTFNADGSCPCGGNRPPYPPAHPAPPHATTEVAPSIVLSWEASDPDDNLSEFDVYFGTESPPPLLVAGIAEASHAVGPLEPLTPHYWRVVARDVLGLEMSSTIWSFTTRPANSPPGVPKGPTPPDGAQNQPLDVTLGWSSSDIDGDLVEFDVYFGSAPDPPLLVAGLGWAGYAPGPLAFGTKYYWRIVARDPQGLESAGPVWSFTTRPANYPPNAPSNPSPPNGAKDQPIDVGLAWQATDPDGDILVFDVYLGTALPPPLVAANVPTKSYAPPELLEYSTTYYWRIIARDPSGAERSSGLTWSFSTRPVNFPPTVPASPSPANGAINRPLNSTLAWQCSDPDNETLVFDVYLGTTSPPPLVAQGHPQKNFNPGLLAYSTKYYWRIVARDPHGAETSGPQWTFTTRANSPPAVPSSPSPPNNSIDRPPTSTLAWECSDPDGHALTYDVYFGAVTPPPMAASSVSTKSYDPGPLALTTKYYWRIVARDAIGAETSGPVWNFTTWASDPPPAPPSNPSPPDNGLATVQPTLTWSASDPFGQPLTFDVHFGTVSPPPLVASGVTEKRYAPGILVVNTTYYWRVVASDGTSSTSGPTWRFRTVTPGGGPNTVGVFRDPAGFDRTLYDVTPRLFDVYVVLNPGTGGATGLQFAAPKPACFTGVWVGEVVAPGFLSIGNTQTGISVALGGCLVYPTHVVTISYFGLGTTPTCCEYPVIPDPSQQDILVVDCNFVELPGTGLSATINPGTCGGGVPVLISRFDAKATRSGVEVRWELSGDETAERFTLLRREESAAYASTAGEGAVVGTTGSFLDASVEAGKTYHYELVVRTALGEEFRSPVVAVTTASLALELGQNHPNPFNPRTTIPYTLANGAVRVRLLILDVSGNLVRTLVDEQQAGGTHEAVWDGKDDRGGGVSSGVYFYVLDAEGRRLTRKLVLLK